MFLPTAGQMLSSRLYWGSGYWAPRLDGFGNEGDCQRNDKIACYMLDQFFISRSNTTRRRYHRIFSLAQEREGLPLFPLLIAVCQTAIHVSPCQESVSREMTHIQYPLIRSHWESPSTIDYNTNPSSNNIRFRRYSGR